MIALGHRIRDGGDYSQSSADLFERWNLPASWRLDGDWMIVGDIHIPFTDYEFSSRVGLVAKKWLPSPRRLLIGGDFFSMDNFSSYIQLAKTPTWQEEKACAKALLDEWLHTFAEIRMILGNHDRRLQKWTMGALNEDDLLALIVSNPERVQMSGFGYCTIDTCAGAWRVTHPRNYSINQLAVAEQLALKHDENIISFHEHHLGMGWDRYGRHVIVNGGCLVDPDKLAYVKLEDSKSDAMMRGFLMLRDGTPYIYGDPPMTDWSKWL